MMKTASETLVEKVSGAAARQHQSIKEFRTTSACTVFGYDEGGFVVMSNNDLLPEVLGYSSSVYRTTASSNPNFEWWLNAISEAGDYYVKNNIKFSAPLPDAETHKPFVDALITTRWGQMEPYNNLCPFGSSTGQYDWQDYSANEGRCVTGCVATAMAQVLNYHQYPATGTNTSNTVYVDHVAYTVEYGKDNYEWSSMLNEYIGDNYTEEEGYAVALLMLHCGVAADMSYATDGSGAYSSNMINGLKKHFGIGQEAQLLDRGYYSADEWMQMVYTEISNNRPILYGGVDMAIKAGHEFVLDGYDENGKVHVNWGWNGRDDGFYDISLLNPPGLRFSSNQDMVIGLDAPHEPLHQYTLEVTEPGTLAELIPEGERLSIDSLTLTGSLNGADLVVVRQIAGRTANGKSTRGQLAYLDLSGAHFVKGGGAFLTQDDREFSITAGNMLPERAFMACRTLASVKLPQDITAIGDAAFALCTRLSELEINRKKGDNYLYEDSVFYSPDKTEIISVMPFCETDLVIEPTIKSIHDYAFAGCCKLNSIKVKMMEPLAVSVNTFREFACPSVTIPVGSKENYVESDGWKWFITEDGYVNTYGTCITARNSARYYGDENPTLRYTVQGEKLVGKPELSCDATIHSHAGSYPIHVDRGTVENEELFIVEGVLKVGRLPLTVSIADASRPRYEANPEFHITSITGFIFDEDESVIKQMPTICTNAEADSPEGEYKFYLKDGLADNYYFEYDGKAVFTITAPTAISALMADGAALDIYSADGILVRRQATTLDGLAPGLYLVGGRKILIP
ncbi:MAG: C10 family peptidase [Prevotella sp.]|nr:C10 family peptidase [Prevotella sp.]